MYQTNIFVEILILLSSFSIYEIMIIVVDDDCFHLTEFLTIGYLNENEFTFLAAYSLDEGADDVQR